MVTQVLLVLPHGGAVQVIRIGLQNTSMVTSKVLPLTRLDGHFVVVAELQEEIYWCITAADN